LGNQFSLPWCLFLSHAASTATAAANIVPHITIMLSSPVCTTFPTNRFIAICCGIEFMRLLDID
jgi:hypothetical protein